MIAAKWCGVHGIDDQGKDPIRIGLVRSFIDNVVTLRSDDSSHESRQSHVLMRVQLVLEPIVLLGTEILCQDKIAMYWC